ncbi:alkyl sulfatase dimerization domain-containing protein [Alkalihalophilus lindianensis]|uniref:Alkyl sulfatase dimerization domain-containing protein n=1 Tax=Alkalihalophilus lindianensis TaxID=1630542 RepID=A0ABU3XCG6_9BACI|nr:alkyl sulfatase dimerization domain-containing protein [Alkalihalophilus lindianensis]MDV2685585.1 alkyl sulfatase dimerization domain-containing protein [Alkalihalophilus lindianensis]
MSQKTLKNGKKKAFALLENHKKRFRKRIEKVTDNIYCAVGYGLGNSTLIVTSEGNIIVDTTESIDVAAEIREEFDKISPLPTAAIIYTHGHADHVNGASVFMDEETEIYSNEKTVQFFDTQFNQLKNILDMRGARQFGVFLPPDEIPCSGLGPSLRFNRNNQKLLFPTKVFKGSMALTIGDVNLQLVSAPGETDDQIYIWIPNQKVLLGADNYYPAFPNLYTIRGTTPRPVLQWVHSLDRMRDLHAEYLVLGHTEPVFGSSRIHELLTMYRDAIQFIHDSTVRGMNQGKTPDQLVEEITLPRHLLECEELRELYGSVAQSVRAIYDGYLGWFDGNATNLERLSSRDYAEKISRLAGGTDQLVEEAKKALEQEDFQWAAELSDMIMSLEPNMDEARKVKIKALTELGLRSYNSNNRSYYLSQARELEAQQPRKKPLQARAAYAHAMPLGRFFSNMAILLKPERCLDQMYSVTVRITDQIEHFQITIRKGVAEIRKNSTVDSVLLVETDEKVWKELVIGAKECEEAVQAGELQYEGDYVLLKQFFALFQ